MRENLARGCRKGSRGTRELLYIDQYILNETRPDGKISNGLDWRPKGIWYGSAKQDNKLPQNVQNITWSHKLYRDNHEKLESGNDSLAEAKIQRGVFQGDALSPLLFIIATMPLNHTLRKCTARYKLSRSHEKINHLMYMCCILTFDPAKTCHSKDVEVAYSIGVGELDWQYGTR